MLTEATVLADHSDAQRYLDIAGVIFLVINADETIRLINRKGCELLGYREEEIIGWNWFDHFIPATPRKKVREIFRQIMNGQYEPVEHFENAVVTRNGNRRIIAWTNTLLVNNQGEIHGTLSSGEDITEKRAAEQALRKNEEKYRNLFNHSNDGILIHDMEGNILEANQKALRLFGYTKNEIQQYNIVDLHSQTAETLKTSETAVQKVRTEGNYNFEINFKKKNGRTFPAEVSASSFEAGDKILVQDVLRDIKERRQANQALRRSEKKYRSFFEEDLTGDYISTPEGKILFCNPAFLKMFGFRSIEEAQNTPAVKLYPQPEDRQKFLDDLKRYKKLENYEMEYRQLNRKPVQVVGNIIGVFNGSGELKKIKGYLYDITQHKQMERQFLQAQKMEAVGRLAGGLAHDFNNMLSIIEGYSQMLLQKMPPDNTTKNYVNNIQKAGRKAGSLTQKLLAFSRRQVLKPAILNLNRLIEDMQDMIRSLISERIPLITHFDADLRNIKADLGQIEQVIMNLVVNAKDAMSEGGKLTIETKNVQFTSEHLKEQVVMNAGSYVMLSVNDTGEGMDAETRSQIFEPFFTTKDRDKGTGLGLSTVYGIVKQSGGYIWVYSEPGEGTTFKIYFPQVTREMEKAKPKKISPASLKGTETILMVEDDEGIRDLVRIILSRYGYRLLIASNKEEAIEKCQENPDKIDLIMVDVFLPKIKGTELMKQLSKIHPESKALFMSGYTDFAAVEQGFLKSEEAFLQKPFGPDDLLLKVREVLDMTNGNGEEQKS